MARKTIKADLSVKGLQQLQKELENYKKELMDKVERYTVELAKYGIEVAKSNTGNFGKYIAFELKTEPSKDGCKAVIVAFDRAKITSVWKTKEGLKSAEVSPLLMAEFGSGQFAQNPNNVVGVGQGTFNPSSDNAWKEEGWYWVGLDDKLYHSYGISPSMPMYEASQALFEIAVRVAREVFS